MKKIMITFALAMAISNPGFAHHLPKTETKAVVTDHVRKVIAQNNPVQVEVCRNVNTSGDKSGDMVSGAIIGGIIGNNLKGVENGGAIGALLGGMLGHSNSDATAGTQRVCRYETRYNEVSKTIYSHSTIKFWYQGKEYTIQFIKSQ